MRLFINTSIFSCYHKFRSTNNIESHKAFCNNYHFSKQLRTAIFCLFVCKTTCVYVLYILEFYHTVVYSAQQYLSHLHQAPRLRFYVFSTSDTGQIYVTETLVTLGRPRLVFEHLPSYGKQGDDLKFSIRVKNPLDIELTNCVLRIDGNIMEERLTLQQR